ncbi:MAG: hypothetical protein ACPGSI_15085 [Pikeienuella sp.]
MADRVFMPRALDSNGNIVSGAVAYFYQDGTTTPLTVYSDTAGLTELGTSVIANSAGAFGAVYTNSALSMDIQTPQGTSLPDFPSDNWLVVPSQGVGASTITFEPIEGNDATDTQTAIANHTTLFNAESTLGRSLTSGETAAAMRTTLGLGTSATQSADDFATAAQGTKADDALPAADNPVKAWVAFDGDPTVTIAQQSGVSGVTRQSQGVYRVTLSTARPNASYGVLATAGTAAQNRRAAHYHIISTTVFELYVINHGNGVFEDADFITAMVLD